LPDVQQEEQPLQAAQAAFPLPRQRHPGALYHGLLRGLAHGCLRQNPPHRMLHSWGTEGAGSLPGFRRGRRLGSLTMALGGLALALAVGFWQLPS
jgi:hypothetical protein